MNRIRLWISVLCVAATMLLALPAGTLAAAPTRGATAAGSTEMIATTPDGAIYLTKSPVERSSATASSSAGGASGLAVAAGGCWVVTWVVFQNNLLGQRIWEYRHKTNWCSADGLTVTATPQVVRWGSVYLAGWSYEIWGAVQKWWGANRTSYRSFSQGHFTGLCSPFGCENKYPWIDQTVYPNGTVGGDAGV